MRLAISQLLWFRPVTFLPDSGLFRAEQHRQPAPVTNVTSRDVILVRGTRTHGLMKTRGDECLMLHGRVRGEKCSTRLMPGYLAPLYYVVA